MALMLAWQRGTEEAFEGLVEAYSGSLWGLFTRFLGTSAEREDLIQETFLRVVRARDRYRPTARFSTFLYRIAFNLAVNRSERARPSAEAPGGAGSDDAWHDFVDEAAEDPSLPAERADVVRAVRLALDMLPESQRMALILAKYEGLSLAEIGAVIGSSEKAVKSLVHRARENLRARLAPYMEEGETAA